MSHISLTYHIIWRTHKSERTIFEDRERDLYNYIFGICKQLNCHLYRINSMPDHVHMCVEVHPTLSLSDFMRTIKKQTSVWIKNNKSLFPCFDGWGNGYAAFTYSAEERNVIIEYIKKQKEHHKRLTFKEEYEFFMKKYQLDLEKDKFLEG